MRTILLTTICMFWMAVAACNKTHQTKAMDALKIAAQMHPMAEKMHTEGCLTLSATARAGCLDRDLMLREILGAYDVIAAHASGADVGSDELEKSKSALRKFFVQRLPDGGDVFDKLISEL